MKNLTLLSLTILSSMQNSPYLQVPSANIIYRTDMSKINAKNFLCSFFITRSISQSYFSHSKFENFISTLPVLAFNAESSYGNIIIRGHNDYMKYVFSIFHSKSYSNISDCQFLSIVDPGSNTPSLDDVHGLVIYSRVEEVRVERCYFFSVTSYRSGGAIYVDDLINETNQPKVTVAKVSQNNFRSVSLYTQSDVFSGYIGGACVQFGQSDLVYEPATQTNRVNLALIKSANIEYCAMYNDGLFPVEPNHFTNGLINIAATEISVNAINFSHTKTERNGVSSGLIHTFIAGKIRPYYRQLSFSHNQFSIMGILSFYIGESPSIDVRMANILNNTAVRKPISAMVTIQFGVETGEAEFHNIVCNDPYPLIGYYIRNGAIDVAASAIRLANTLFQADLNYHNDNKTDVLENQENVNPIVLDELSKITSIELAQTEAFTMSNSFTPLSYQKSATIFELRGESAITAGVLATIFGILSFIAFLFLLYMRRGNAQKYHVIGKFERRDDFDEVYTSSDSDISRSDGGYASDRPSSGKKSGNGSRSKPVSTKKNNKTSKSGKKKPAEDLNYSGYSYSYGSYSYSYSNERPTNDKI